MIILIIILIFLNKDLNDKLAKFYYYYLKNKQSYNIIKLEDKLKSIK